MTKREKNSILRDLKYARIFYEECLNETNKYMDRYRYYNDTYENRLVCEGLCDVLGGIIPLKRNYKINNKEKLLSTLNDLEPFHRWEYNPFWFPQNKIGIKQRIALIDEMIKKYENY